MPSIRFVNMWEGFNPHWNPLMPMVRAAQPSTWTVVQDRRAKVDLEIGSSYPTRWDLSRGIAAAALKQGLFRSPPDVRESFPPPTKSESARVGIWYTAENKRPPVAGWDATLSFDSSGWPANAYLPFWQLNSDLFGGNFTGFLGETLRVDSLVRSRAVGSADRPGFCCAILRNPDPVRLKAIELLQHVGRVDVFGPLTRRPVQSKSSILRNYRYTLVFENDLYPGYITEKIFDAWACGTVPLYWGWDSTNQLNPSAMLNMADMNGPIELVERVVDLERDAESRIDLVSQPLLLKLPDPEPVLQLVRTALSS